ncbi:YceI family protein [Kibdelosporangium phytohabitans]|nr:YceI family protein [Kibdelosporangium phytohabitans]MBE1469998.1 polyisoprenoid-binding protein YceI [Kibdelosporangium phytohabitans]
MTQSTLITGDYRIDAQRTTIGFTTRHMFGLGRVRGTFRLRDGHIHVADRIEESVARATVAADSVDTGNSMRDATVRQQYLDVVNHPDIVFSSSGVERVDDAWVLRGKLMVCGRTKPVDLRVTDVRDGLRATASCVIDRYEFGITKMKGMTGRRLAFTLDVVANLST